MHTCSATALAAAYRPSPLGACRVLSDHLPGLLTCSTPPACHCTTSPDLLRALYETTSLACTTIRLPLSCCPAPLGPLNIRPFSAHDHPTFSAAAHFSLACQFRLTHLPLDLLTLCDILIFAASGVRRPRMSSFFGNFLPSASTHLAHVRALQSMS